MGINAQIRSRYEAKAFDSQTAAIEAARSVAYHAFMEGRGLSFNECVMIHRQFKAVNEATIEALAETIARYGHAHTVTWNAADGSVLIQCSDAGSPELGVVLATCWLDNHGSLYWEY